MYTVLLGREARREEDGFLKDSRSEPSPETGTKEIQEFQCPGLAQTA